MKLSESELKDFFDFLSIKSMGTTSEYAEDMNKTVQWLEKQMVRNGIKDVCKIHTEGYPIVYGKIISKKNSKTILLYGHYDVQPAFIEEGWTQDPFKPVIKDDKIYARGTTDCKGGIFACLTAVKNMVDEKNIPINLKFLFEGEEESGSPSLRKALTDNKDLFQADLIISMDGCGAGSNPVIRSGFKGMCGVEIELTGTECELHSGMAGQMVHNPAMVLCDIVSSMKKDGKITIDGFYDQVVEISEEEKKAFAESTQTDEEYKKSYSADYLFGEAGYTPTERLFARPTLDVNGILSGYVKNGVKNIIPSKAICKIGCRLVNDQDPDYIYKCIEHHVLERIPKGISVKMKPYAGGIRAYVLPMDLPAVKVLKKIDTEIYGTSPKFIRSGGTLPLSRMFYDIFHRYLIGFGPYSFVENVHGPNEYVRIENLERIIKWLPRLILGISEVL